jgi:hypothetical protein
MDPIEEFHRHASECRRMARVASSAQSRDAWKGMAERWVRCAAEFETTQGEAKTSAARRRNASEAKRQRERREELGH